MIARIFVGLYLVFQGLALLGIATVGAPLLGVLALIGGIAWLAGF